LGQDERDFWIKQDFPEQFTRENWTGRTSVEMDVDTYVRTSGRGAEADEVPEVSAPGGALP